MQVVEKEETAESPAPSAHDVSSSLANRPQRATSSLLTAVGRSAAAGPAAAGGGTSAAGPSNLGRPAAAPRETSALDGPCVPRGPSVGIARTSASVLSGEWIPSAETDTLSRG